MSHVGNERPKRPAQRMDSANFREIPPAPGRPAAPGYREIGDALLIAESSFLAVGVPWLFPTNSVRQKRAKNSLADDAATPAEFFKVMLVSVPTNSLESYLEDLTALPLNRHGAKALGIDGVTLLERSALPIAAFVCCFLLVYLGSIVSKLENHVAYGFAAVGGAMSALLTISSSFERNRRRSFYWHLNEELMRRHGVVNASPSSVISLRVDPLTGAE